jgi:hypothetical protein
MYWSAEMHGYEDICVRCGKQRGPARFKDPGRENITDITHKLRINPPSKL